MSVFETEVGWLALKRIQCIYEVLTFRAPLSASSIGTKAVSGISLNIMWIRKKHSK